MRSNIVILALMCLVSGFSHGAEKISVTGPAKNIRITDEKGLTGSFLCDGERNPAFEYDKASVRVNEKTKILRLQGDKLVPATLKDLKEGGQVDVWLVGPVAESYPVQGTAGKIVIK
ncbi:MAG: DUF3221 domain-containing protein [Zavarzinella sp.]